jgi:phage repressor protein C with HTH and peptisase S24 domain
MKLVGVISTAVLSLALGVAVPAFAQEQHEQEGQKAPAAQDEKKAQPEKSTKQAEKPATQPEKNAKPEEKNAQQENKSTKPAEKNAQQQQKNTKPAEKNAQPQQRAGNNGGGRIPDAKFKANFGQQHSFRVTQADYSNHRFQYGGYSFGFVDPWPSNWLYTQNVYVIEINGVYYLCNASFPGVNLALSFTP